MKLYKVITADNKSQHGGDFDWTDYLPTDEGPGKWTPEVEPVWCKSGYHITPYPCMWFESEHDKVFLVEVAGEPVHECVGSLEKLTAKSIRLVADCSGEFCSPGHMNSGDMNSGHMNSGSMNSGGRNSGNRNSGDMNSGHRNSGDMNSGHMNSGDMNSGSMNSGGRNSGDMNSGDINSGNMNSGDSNSGDMNSGNRNSGNWNSTDGECGFFCSKQPETIRVFNKPCDLATWEAADIPSWLYFKLDPELGYQGSFQKAYKEASEEEREKVKQLPNFDADVFYEISGIDLRGKS